MIIEGGDESTMDVERKQGQANLPLLQIEPHEISVDLLHTILCVFRLYDNVRKYLMVREKEAARKNDEKKEKKEEKRQAITTGKKKKSKKEREHEEKMKKLGLAMRIQGATGGDAHLVFTNVDVFLVRQPFACS